MKAKPVKLTPLEGYQQCPLEEATHVTLRLPGPTGLLTLPVISKGSRKGTGCWTWNGNVETPTLHPSVLTQYDGADGSWRCHSWISGGEVKFLDDCSHDRANTIETLLEVEEPSLDELIASNKTAGEELKRLRATAARWDWLTDGKRGDYIWEYVLTNDDKKLGHWTEDVIDARLAQSK